MCVSVCVCVGVGVVCGCVGGCGWVCVCDGWVGEWVGVGNVTVVGFNYMHVPVVYWLRRWVEEKYLPRTILKFWHFGVAVRNSQGKGCMG